MATGDLTATLREFSNIPSAVFDGVDDYVEIPHNAAHLGAALTAGFTISAWIFPEGLGEGPAGDFARIIDKSAGTTGQSGYRFHLTGATDTLKFRVQFRMNSTSTPKSSLDNSADLNVWNHIVVTVNSAQICNIYINGVVSGSATDLVQPISTITTTNAIRIGNRATATDRTFNGAIAKVKMWNKVLSTDEIKQDYYGEAVATSNLVLDVPLAADYDDDSSLALTGTNSGTYLTQDIPGLNLTATTDMANLQILENHERLNVWTAVAVNRSA